MTIVIATRNQGKMREFERLFRAIAPTVEWKLEDAVRCGLPDVQETGLTFMDNARIKAISGAAASGLVCLGEDSGLEVDALDGGPGVRSHRFSPTGRDEDNNRLLLELLKGLPEHMRKARYRCAIVVASPQGIITESEGVTEGVILEECRGLRGFGYDPLFYSLDLGKTFGEASDEEKDRVSHRRRALEPAIAALLRWKA